jgi:solute carrier family 25 S-adenosylmethionine transporter 26
MAEETSSAIVFEDDDDLGGPSSLKKVSFSTALVAGGMAGTAVDVALFPIDTLKTRLQAPAGFWNSGGFRGIYNGLSAAAVGSAPGAALFFATYETTKVHLAGVTSSALPEHSPTNHMISASVGEAVACLVRVPTEVIKAKMQTSQSTFSETLKLVWSERTGTRLSNIFGGLYRGYGITFLREIPFAMIQFPLYEKFKQSFESGCTPVQAAACGSISGGIAAAVTTPLDVLKTRLMLGYSRSGQPYANVWDVMADTTLRGYFAGIQPRVLWITLGGFVFFGAYEQSKTLVSPYFMDG